MKPPRTPAQMTFDVNALNGNSVNGTHNPVTVAQMEAIYAEARKIEWTDKRPTGNGFWPCRMGGSIPDRVVRVDSRRGVLFDNNCYRIDGPMYNGCQWSTRPIDMPEEARKELSK